MKGKRQQTIRELLRKGGRYVNQQELVAALLEEGIEATQASVSRDIHELGLIKVQGFYVEGLTEKKSHQGGIGELISIKRSGDTLLVVKTSPGMASAAATVMDRSKCDGLVGTIAGDDTIFVAVESKSDWTRVWKHLVDLFKVQDFKVQDTKQV